VAVEAEASADSVVAASAAEVPVEAGSYELLLFSIFSSGDIFSPLLDYLLHIVRETGVK
jgi:hypothetical protein